MRKLDRVLVNGGWMTDFPHSFAEFHPFGVSDHTPIVVHVGVGSSVGKKSFKFFNYWAEFDEFLPTVEKAWNTEFRGYKMFQVYQKLREVKKALRALHQQKRMELHMSLNSIRAELFDCQRALARFGATDDLIQKEADCLDRLNMVSKMEESSAMQKSRIQWLKEGDQNSS